MVRILSFFIFCLFLVQMTAQELKWIYKIGGTTAEYGNGLTIDSDQNIYDITNFMGTVSVAPMVSYTSRGQEDIIIRKSTSLGIQQWIRQVGSKQQDIAYDIATDADKNIIVVGTFLDTLYMGTDLLLVGSPTIIQSFVLKLSSAGTMLWVKKFESNISVTAKCVTAGLSDDLLVSGTFEGNALFGMGFPGFSDGGHDIFVLNLDGNTGEPIFIRRIGGTDQEYIHQHVRDKQNNIYLTGDFRSNLDLDPGNGTFNVSSNGLTDVFLVKLTAAGTFQYGKTYGGAGVDYGYSVCVDQQNSVFLAGRFSESISFGNNTLTSKGGTDIFLTKLNALGNVVWANSYGDVQNDQANRVIVNNNGIVYLGGIFRGKVDFDPGSFNNSSDSKGGADAFIVVYNQDGTYNDHFSLGGIANEQLADIALKFNGELISTGGFGAIADFDPTSSEVNIFSNGGLDAFLWNTFICINPYLKTFHAEKTELCPGEKVFIQIDEGYLNDATQWSWQRDSCRSITFASGDFLNINVDRNTTFFIKGFGGCVLNDQCKKIDIKLFKDSLIYQAVDLCQGDTLKVGNNRYTFGGVFIDSLQSKAGCDSVVVTEITMYPTYRRNQSVSICNGDSVRVGNAIYTLAGTYTANIVSINGCDSIITTNVTVLPSSIDNAEAIICKGDSVKVGNVTYSQAGIYIQSSIGSNGCENILIVKIKVLETEFNNIVRLCFGDSLVVGTSIYTTSGIYTDHLVSTFGCDSIVKSTVLVNNKSQFSQEVSICFGDSVKVGNKVYKTDGKYVDILTNILGCDSTVFTNIKVFPLPVPVSQVLTICEGDSVVVGGNKYKMSGLYHDTLSNINGCDSVVNTQLTVLQRKFNINAEICEDDFVQVGTLTFNKEGVFEIPFKNILNCDSIIVLTLKVNVIKKETYEYSICPGDSIVVGNSIYSQAGIYTDTFSTKAGCDSIITSRLFFNHTRRSLRFELCQGEGVTINNKLYNLSGIYTDTIVKANKCDSILDIQIILHPTYVKDTIFEICKGGNVKIGTSTYFNAGFFSEVLQSKKGCDSLVNFEIRIINFIPIFSVSKDTLKTFKFAGAQYQWFECINNEKIPFLGAVQSEFVILKSGRYALGITFKGCTYLSDCIDVIISSTNDGLDENFKYYPNPVTDVIQIRTSSNGTLKLISNFGQILSEYNIIEGKQEINIEEVLPGAYYLMWTSGNKVGYYKVIKQ